jgi:hypothetical protein
MKLSNQPELNLPSILLTLILQITAKKINNKKNTKTIITNTFKKNDRYMQFHSYYNFPS